MEEGVTQPARPMWGSQPTPAPFYQPLSTRAPPPNVDVRACSQLTHLGLYLLSRNQQAVYSPRIVSTFVAISVRARTAT